MTQSVMTSQTMDNFDYRRKMRKADYTPIPHRWHYVLDLHLAGYKARQIKDITNYSQGQVYRILSHPDIIHLKQQKMAYYDEMFQDLYPKVVAAVDENLDHEDPKVRNDAAKIWLKAHGKFGSNIPPSETKITAEQIVVQILNQAREIQSKGSE